MLLCSLLYLVLLTAACQSNTATARLGRYTPNLMDAGAISSTMMDRVILVLSPNLTSDILFNNTITTSLLNATTPTTATTGTNTTTRIIPGTTKTSITTVTTIDSITTLTDMAGAVSEGSAKADLGTTAGRHSPYDPEEMEKIKMIGTIEMYLSTVVISCGIIGNILALLTLQSPELKEAPYTYLKALAWADLSALLLAYSRYLVELSREHISTTSYAYVWWSAHFYYPLINVAVTMTTSIMVVMTAERCAFIYSPLKARTHFTSKQTLIKIGIALVFSSVINFPRVLWYKPDLIQQLSVNGSEAWTVTKYLHGTDFAKAVTWIHSAVLHCLPLVFLIFLNALLIYKFRRQRGRSFVLGISRTIVTIWDREQNRLTYTYIAIVCIFIITTMPSAFADDNISNALFGANQLVTRSFQYASNFLMWVNLSSLHFIMYAFLNTKFQRAFKIMLRRWRARLRYALCSSSSCCCCCCCCASPDGSNFTRTKWNSPNTFQMVNQDEHVHFNNNKNRLQNQTSNQSTTSKETSVHSNGYQPVVSFRLTDG